EISRSDANSFLGATPPRQTEHARQCTLSSCHLFRPVARYGPGLIAFASNRNSVGSPTKWSRHQARHQMTLRISGKSISVGEALRGRVSERTDEVLRKYFDGNYSGHITLSKDGFGFRTDCSLHLDSGITLEADSNATDAYASADQALLMIEKRLRRYKSRLKDRSARKTYAEAAALAELDAPSYVIEAPADDHDESSDYSPVIIAEATTSLKRLSVSEAV